MRSKQMKLIIEKTLGGLSMQYYLRQFFFGSLILAFTYFIAIQKTPEINLQNHLPIVSLFILNTFLYPYSRFIYESIVDFIMGGTLFLNSLITLILKFITMYICWQFSIFIAPVGLAYLYYLHSKKNKEQTEYQ